MKEYFSDYPDFFNEELRPYNLDNILSELKSKFFEKEYDYNKNNNNENTNEIILITSGGTKVSLEHASIRSVENFSTGKRGAHIGEYFLLKNKKVIFLYRKGTFKPFEYNLKQLSTLNNFEIKNQNIHFNLSNVDNNLLISDIENFRKYEKNIFCIPFETIFDYAFYLIEICKILHGRVKGGCSKSYKNYKNCEFDEIGNIPHVENNSDVIQKGEICCNTPPTEQIYDQAYHMLNNLYNLLLNSELENLISSGKLINDDFFLNVLRQVTEFNNKTIDNMVFEKYPEDETNLFTDLKLFINDMLKILNSWLNKKSNMFLECDISLKEKIYKIIFFMNKISYIVCEKKKKNSVNVNNSYNFNDALFYPLSQIIILCAAVSDYYIPYNKLSIDKIDSDKKNGLNLNMALSPKFYKIIHRHFPLLNICSFKLENNEQVLLKKARDRVKYSDILIANLLNYRYKYVYIFKNKKDYYLLKKSDNFENIEYEISQYIYNHLIDKKLWK
ncbi:phosphopantothenoylcysteine synthetase, putative [Plasmodium berghei]|uniref:Phosphopantothenate--cysteine ligase, putative n=2 Tax=Plasmodium berghei TaxID=5821 RepID=A0A509AGQ8_PLABA|nr:phosphopantothenate--cysteine ligase, putative [Plasmodium berghei ANKA]CXI18430.1 phosphopantothenoylcysteine synthetase, putative [Plasmodium berghei]SCM19777.1 phosphopantothenoylcysteine synthetase, putative [Plasmodium berghei]SCN23518.1 phosphopantothenoylcysteine synthetase, putative [Plasmodium berghei]SCO59123.1 phosphopantothenoylcysteine synthetase, putative [Plasmodium berghei]SCO59836.1 phosphopantothenoylcysteine synthetase, putative [Plasmodium berghei]|eukprot:XP_034420636.1 phosphopantothenate--cysteine ligase, putative [Plasmodium berghei ANKA]